MKKIIIILVILVIVGATWFYLSDRSDNMSLEEAIVLAQANSECAELGSMSAGQYVENYGLWYIDIDQPEETEDHRFVYSCEVNPYTSETKLIVDKAYNWYESDFQDVDQEPVDSMEEPMTEVVDDQIRLTLEEAQLLAMNSGCTELGRFTGDDVYNSATKTWWLGLDLFPELEIENCNPACVVYEEDLRAEENWRCTGLIEE